MNFETYKEMAYINETIAQKALMDNLIDSIYVYDYNDQCLFVSNRKGFLTHNDLKKTKWEEWTNETFDPAPWTLRVDPFGTDRYYISSKKTIMNQEKIVDFYLNVDERTIYNRLKDINVREEGYKILLDRELNIVSHEGLTLIKKPIEDIGFSKEDFQLETDGFTKTIRKEDYLVVYTTSEYLEWKYVALIPMEKIYPGVNKIIRLAIVLMGIVCGVGIIGVLSITKNIYSPIQKLKIAMEAAGHGDFQYELNHERKDEFGIVYRSYNRMVLKIRSLINDVYIEKLLKKEAEMKMLQNQINPHFLYNTLDVLQWMVKANNGEDACRIIHSLSDFYRQVLSEGKSIVKISEELLLIEHYLIIQKNNFKNMFSYHFDVQEELKAYDIPKLMLQPVVENAIIHGFSKRKGEKELVISADLDGEYIVFKIQDNGCGIEGKELEKIRESFKLGVYNLEGNFALQNIHMQITKAYGQECGIWIESQEHRGTCVKVKIKKQLDKGQAEGMKLYEDI